VTPGTRRNFPALAARLLADARSLLVDWLPGGHVRGHEYVCASLKGGHGDSLSVNLNKGVWQDFATGDSGADLLALYASVMGCKMGEAYDALAPRYSLDTGPAQPKPQASSPAPVRPPADAPLPDFKWASAHWTYHDAAGHPLFYVARYDHTDPSTGERSKQVLPYTWSGTGWQRKSWPAPRPLYRLPELLKDKPAPVLVVSGEKCTEAALGLNGPYQVTTWSNGDQALGKTDWSPLRGREKVLIWPDADDSGVRCGRELAQKLLAMGVGEVKLVDVSGQPAKWDVADAVAEGMDTWDKVAAWLAPRAKVVVREAEIAPGDKPAFTDALGQPMSFGQVVEKYGIALRNNGSPVCNEHNVLRVLEHVPAYADLCHYDEFHCEIRKPNGDAWTEDDTLALVVRLQGEMRMANLHSRVLQDAITVYARRRARNEVLDWLDALEWDGKERLGAWLSYYCGAEFNEYTASVGKAWWISMVARIKQPGCQVDTMLILEGLTGAGKSTTWRYIGGQYHGEVKRQVTDKDFYVELKGVFLAEMAELQVFNRSEVSALKQAITNPIDRYRPPYGRTVRTFPRQCVFVGTTNDHQYLDDPTGARRFWPVRVGTMRTEDLKRDRDQLFAEARVLFERGVPWHVVHGASDEQEARRIGDEWEDDVASYLNARPPSDMVKIMDIAVEVFHFRPRDVDRSVQLRLGRIMRVLGWERFSTRAGGGAGQRGWIKKEKPA
jgi:putative DNA primase/helicase